MSWDWLSRIMRNYGTLFLSGAGITILLSLITVVGGTVLGTAVVLLRRSRWKALNVFATAYVELIRGTPLLLQLYLFYFGFDFMGKALSITLALIVNSSAYVAEIIRSGLTSVEKGQAEAAESLGLTRAQTMAHVVFPQAVRVILPSLGNEFVSVIKESSLASTFFLGDIMTVSKSITGFTYRNIEPLVIVAVIYFILTFTLGKGIARMEKRMALYD